METCDTDLTCQHHKNEINCLRQNCSCLKEDRERNIPQLQQINGVKSLVHIFTVSESPDPGNPWDQTFGKALSSAGLGISTSSPNCAKRRGA
jgi:hypothetical protein